MAKYSMVEAGHVDISITRSGAEWSNDIVVAPARRHLREAHVGTMGNVERRTALHCRMRI